MWRFARTTSRRQSLLRLKGLDVETPTLLVQQHRPASDLVPPLFAIRRAVALHAGLRAAISIGSIHRFAYRTVLIRNTATIVCVQWLAVTSIRNNMSPCSGFYDI